MITTIVYGAEPMTDGKRLHVEIQLRLHYTICKHIQIEFNVPRCIGFDETINGARHLRKPHLQIFPHSMYQSSRCSRWISLDSNWLKLATNETETCRELEQEIKSRVRAKFLPQPGIECRLLVRRVSIEQAWPENCWREFGGCDKNKCVTPCHEWLRHIKRSMSLAAVQAWVERAAAQPITWTCQPQMSTRNICIYM